MILYQVNRILCKRNLTYNFLRYIHNEQQSKVLYPLANRGLLKVAGDDASTFLQGLITNDMRHFEEGAKSMYAMFLNNKGRVLYDTLIHKWDNDNTFMLECDKNVVTILQKHLKMFKLRRQVNIEDVNDIKIWAFITPSDLPDLCNQPINEVNVYKDPRLVDLGYRILSNTKLNGSQVADQVERDAAACDSDEGYTYLRFKLGVSEGCNDLPPGSSFPLEANCDYLHGVSFHKGCYIGQELTARVHHTGVVRKRIMPLKFAQEVKDNIEKDSVIVDADKPKSNLGKLKSYIKDYGLGLVRTKEAMGAKSIAVGNHSIEVMKPTWWPKEAPKESFAKIE